MASALVEAGGDQTRVTVDGVSIYVNPVVAVPVNIPPRGGVLHLPPGTFTFYSGIDLLDNVTVKGSGIGTTILRVAQGQNFDVITATGKNGITVSDLTIQGPGAKTGTNRHGILFNSCNDCLIERVEVIDPDGIGVVMVDSNRCTVSKCVVKCSDARYNNGAGADIAWAYWMDCCSDSTFDTCYAHQVGFGFSIVGNDSAIAGTNDHMGTRTIETTMGNSIINCRVHRFTGHAYNINYCPGNTVSACVARTYQGAQTDRAAFQSKSSDGDDPRGNKFVGCTAIDIGTGFQAQEGSRTQLADFVVRGAVFDGVRINSSPYAQISNVTVDGYGQYGVTVEGGSPSVSLDGLYATASSASCIAVRISNSGSSSIDNVMCRETHAKSIQIAADSNYVTLGSMVHATYGIDDQAPNTLYPITASCSLSASGGSNKSGLLFPASAIAVGRVDVSTIEAVTGTAPTVTVAGMGGSPAYANAVAASAAVGSVVSVSAATLGSSSALPAGKYLEATSSGSGSAGKLMVSIGACRAQ